MMFTRLLEGLCTETDRREDVVRQRAGLCHGITCRIARRSMRCRRWGEQPKCCARVIDFLDEPKSRDEQVVGRRTEHEHLNVDRKIFTFLCERVNACTVPILTSVLFSCRTSVVKYSKDSPSYSYALFLC